MASLQCRNGSYRVLFRYLGKQHTVTLGEVAKEEAEAKSAQVDYLLLRLKQRLAVLPAGASIVDYVQFDGQVVPASAPRIQLLSLSDLQHRYLHSNEASLEPNTLECIRIHFRHLERAFGPEFEVTSLKLADLQRYVDQRAKAKGRKGGKLSATTIQKEIVTLRTAWNWAERMELVTGRFPNRGLRYPKTTERPPFMTRAEIERRLATGGLTEAEQAELWDALYLTADEVKELLQYVKTSASQPFVPPMLTFAAYTGARRSEMRRLKIGDVDLEGRTATIQEKKRVRGKTTIRTVPLSLLLVDALKDWLAIHPGGPHLFCVGPTVPHSRKRGNTRSRGVTALTADEAHHHLKQALADSKWSVIKGWHIARHAFISGCVVAGIDQRMLMRWVGHQTQEMQNRYTHLAPKTQQEALARVFA